MSDNAKNTKSNDEIIELNLPSTSGWSPNESSLPIIITKTIKIETANTSKKPDGTKSTVAFDAIEEVLERCEKTHRDRQISVLFPVPQFDSLTSSLRTLRPSQSCMSNTALRCFLMQNLTSQARSECLKKWDQALSGKYTSKVDTATQSTPRGSYRTLENVDIFSRDAVAATASHEIQITPSLVPPRPVVGEPPVEGAPPSYSAVMRIGPTRPSPRRLFGRRVDAMEPSPPFISPTPPPTYAEAQGHFYRPTVVDSGVPDMLWGPDPMPAACQRCGTYVITQITNQRSNMTHFAALALCICGCWPCCLLPYCMNSCKNTYHYCPNCNTYLGMYRPWS